MRWAARADAWVPFLMGIACIVWLFIVPHERHHSAADWGGRESEMQLMALLAAPVLIVIAIPYLVLSILVRRTRLWAIAVLAALAAAQGLAMAFISFVFLSDDMRAPLLGLTSAAYTALLFATAALGVRLSIELWSNRPRRRGFPVVVAGEA